MTKVKNIDKIRYGDYEIDAWYVSPYPDEYSKAAILYICEYCLAYMRTEAEYCCHVVRILFISLVSSHLGIHGTFLALL